jgi:hypothetical protein
VRLSQLEAHFVKLIMQPADEHWPKGRPCHRYCEMAEADGIFFLCPKCFSANGGSVGTHQVGCWFKGRVPDWIEPNPGRWNPSGTGIEDLTFVPPGAVSVWLTAGCGAHFFVKNGDAT